MELTPIIATLALLLAGTFVWSGTAKLLRPFETAIAIKNFGMTRTLRISVARIASGAEVFLGVLLVVGVMVPRLEAASSASASLALAFFSVLLERGRRGGASFACMCFGGADKPIDLFTVLRTATLASAAVAVAISEATGWIGRPDASAFLAYTIIAASALGLAALSSAIGRIGKPIDPYDFADASLVRPSISIEEVQTA